MENNALNSGDSLKILKMKDFWAKTDPVSGLPCLSVLDHCLIVGTVAKILLQQLPKSVRNQLPSNSITLVASHDIGKLTPGFQLKAVRWPWHKDLQKKVILDSLCSNHAVVSQWHLQTHSILKDHKSAQNWLISTGGHHGSYPFGSRLMKSSPYEGGIECFTTLREELLQILIDRFGPLPLEEAKNKLERIHLLTGFTIFSDWIGSNTDWFPKDISTDSAFLEEKSQQVITALNRKPLMRRNLSFGQQFSPQTPEGFVPRSIQSALLSAVDTSGLYIVEAPMGMGKTEAALTAAYRRWTQGEERGLYFALPTQLTSNKVHDRINEFLNNTLANESFQALIHSKAWLNDERSRLISPDFQKLDFGAPEDEQNDVSEPLRWYSSTRRQLLAPFGTGTIDQALLAILPARFAALRYFALAGKVVVIDEVHSFDPYMSALIDRLIGYLLKAGSTVIILSATLTARRRAELVKAAGAVESAPPMDYPLITKVEAGATNASHILIPESSKNHLIYLKHEKLNRSNEDVFWDDIVRKVETGGNVVVIRNTIELAQNTYRDLKSRLSSRVCDVHIGLIHSRFPQNERDAKENYWTRVLGKSEADRPNGSLLIATQIVEQSVDIDADCLVTDLAPTELILQRIGRLHRHNRIRPIGFEKATCHILYPDTDWRGDIKAVKAELNPHHWIYPPLSLWQATQTFSTIAEIKLPYDIRPLLEQSATLQPGTMNYPEVKLLVEDFKRKNDTMQGTAKLRDVFNARAIDDQEGMETRYGMKPSALLVVLAKAPVEQGGRITLQLTDSSIHVIRVGEFNYPLAKALQSIATRIPAYLVHAQLIAAPDWLRLHIDSGVLAIQSKDSTQLQLLHGNEAPYTLHFRKDIGITYEKARNDLPITEPEDFWF